LAEDAAHTRKRQAADALSKARERLEDRACRAKRGATEDRVGLARKALKLQQARARDATAAANKASEQASLLPKQGGLQID